jgi:predicted nucleic acid-binding Zn ribbon protein
MSLSSGDQAYSIGNCSLDLTHKYICEDTSDDIMEHERRWKDTTMVHSYQVFVLRVRWASTLYDPSVKSYPYFNIPEEHLVEFPGFVYHCHLIPHEDNEMMRSYSLQYSDFYKSTITPAEERKSCARTSWWDQMKCINDKLGCPMKS